MTLTLTHYSKAFEFQWTKQIFSNHLIQKTSKCAKGNKEKIYNSYFQELPDLHFWKIKVFGLSNADLQIWRNKIFKKPFEYYVVTTKQHFDKYIYKTS